MVVSGLQNRTSNTGRKNRVRTRRLELRNACKEVLPSRLTDFRPASGPALGNDDVQSKSMGLVRDIDLDEPENKRQKTGDAAELVVESFDAPGVPTDFELLVGTGEKKKSFHVHKVFLANVSSVFADMFSNSEPSGEVSWVHRGLLCRRKDALLILELLPGRGFAGQPQHLPRLPTLGLPHHERIRTGKVLERAFRWAAHLGRQIRGRQSAQKCSKSRLQMSCATRMPSWSTTSLP